MHKLDSGLELWGGLLMLLGGCFRQESDYPTFLSFGSP